MELPLGHLHGINKVAQEGATRSDHRGSMFQQAYQGLELVLGGCALALPVSQSEPKLREFSHGKSELCGH